MTPKEKLEFDQYAESYSDDLLGAMPSLLEEDSYFAEYKIQYLARVMKDELPARILDFGCGIGRSLKYLQVAFPEARLWGYDVSTDSIEQAKTLLPDACLTSSLDDLQGLQFDVVFVANVLHHVAPPERSGFLSICRSLLVDSGKLYVFEHNPFNPLTRLVFERCPYDKDASMLCRRDMLSLFESSGIELDGGSYTLFFPKQLSWLRSLEKWLGWLPLGAQYCVVGKKNISTDVMFNQ